MEGVLFRSSTFDDEGEWVGPKAAEDLARVQEIYEDLKRLQKACQDLKVDWPRPTRLIYGAERPYALEPPMVSGYPQAAGRRVMKTLSEGPEGLYLRPTY
jgi:hypothetical protein